MSEPAPEKNTHKTTWRELSRNLAHREILYFISGYPDGVREAKIKSSLHDLFKYSFQGSLATQLKILEDKSLITKETTKSGVAIWHANQPQVIAIIQNELEEMKHRESELRDLHTYLISMYAD